MAIVVDPKQKIEEKMKSLGYLPSSPENCPADTFNALIHSAALVFNELLGVDFTTQGYCWASSVTRKSCLEAIVEAVEKIEENLSCYGNSELSTTHLILNKWRSLNKD